MKLALDFAVKQNSSVCLRYPKEIVPDDEFDRSACGSLSKQEKALA